MAGQNFPDNVLYNMDNLDVLRGTNSETVDLVATGTRTNTDPNEPDLTKPGKEPQITVEDYTDLLARLESGNIDLVLTDPPYTISKNTGFKNCGTRGVKRLRVNMDFGEWDKSMIDLPQLARLVYSCLRKGGTAIIWYDLWKLSYLSQAMLEAGFKQRRLIV